MKLYAQQGYGTGAEGGRIVAGLEQGFIHGAILSPKDYSRTRAEATLGAIQSEFPDADRFFDPQYYAALLALDDGCRLGKLDTDDYEYFEPRRRSQLESESNIRTDLRSCLRVQASMAVSAAIAPNVVIRRSFNSIEAVIAKNFIRNAVEAWEEVGDNRPLFVTLAMDAEALQERYELDEFLADITLLDHPPHGFYLLINNTTSEIHSELVDHRTLAGWMLLNHSLSLNGFEVINGFSDILTPFLSAAGGSAGATGWWSNLKVFSLDRFQASSGGGRRPVFRYLSKSLLNSIRFDELQRLRNQFPSVLNDLTSDKFYNEEEGSQPDGQEQEILQTWDAISSFSGRDESATLDSCLLWLNNAGRLYDEINASPGLRLMARSNNSHVDSLRAGVQLFAELAEIDLG